MNPAVVARALLTRIQADTTLYSTGWTSALAGGASFSKAGPASPSFPYLVYSVEATGEHFLGGLEGPVEITFTVFDQDAFGTDRMEVVIDRLIGNAVLAGGTWSTPTYGFHNHLLSLPAIGSTNVLGTACSELNLTSASIGPSDTISVNQASITFNGRLSKQATNV